MNLRWVLTRFVAQFRKRRLERELDDEILAHLELAEGEAIATSESTVWPSSVVYGAHAASAFNSAHRRKT